MKIDIDEIDFDDYMYFHNDKPFTGVGFELSCDGKLISEMEFQKGLLSGISRDYYPNGVVQSEISYKNNGIHGPSKHWNESGELESEEIFECGICIERRIVQADGSIITAYKMTKDDPNYEVLELFRSCKLEND